MGVSYCYQWVYLTHIYGCILLLLMGVSESYIYGCILLISLGVFLVSEKMAARNQTKDLKCATHLLNDKFRNMTEEKKAIVRDLGFGGLMHIPPLRVHHQVLRELANNFKLGENRLETRYGSFKITPKKIGDALGINATGNSLKIIGVY